MGKGGTKRVLECGRLAMGFANVRAGTVSTHTTYYVHAAPGPLAKLYTLEYHLTIDGETARLSPHC